MSQSIEFIHRHSSALERIASGLTLQQNTVNSDGKIFCKKDAANIVFSEDEQRVVAEARKAAKEQQIELKSEPKPDFTLNLAIEASKVCRIVRLPKNCVAMAEATVRSLIRWTYGTSDPITKDFLLEYLKSANHPDPAVFLCQEKVVGCYTKNYPQALELVGREAMIEEGVASIKEGRVLLMHGLSGNGKTQLAIHCVAEASEDADAIIWEVGDNSLQPLTLARLLDSMADKLHKSELKDIPKESEKVTKICRFLKDSGIKVYLVIDNFNAIPQQNMRSVINFISDNFSKLPDCRTIITTQANPNTQIQRCINMSIPGLSEDQGVKLMLSRLGDVAINEDSLRAISHATGGNPQVLLTAVQMLKEFDTTEEILLSLQDCADKNGWFTAFYKTVWEHLSSEVKQIVLATSLFPKSVSIKALEQVTGLEDFKSHLIHAYDYCLVERYKFQVEDGIEEQRISQHELVRRVAERELNRPENAEMVAELHQRWSEWAIEFSAPFERDVVWNDHSFLQKLDDHEFSDLISLQRFLDWSEEQGDRNTFLKVSGNLRFFYYTRGFWAAEKEMSLKRVRVAKDLGYQNMALDSLLYHINVACKQGNKAEIEKHISEMLRLYNECCKTGLSWIEMVEYNHVCALIAQVQKKPKLEGKVFGSLGRHSSFN